MSMMPTHYLYSIIYTVNIIMDFAAFSHGQIQSKLWLCEGLEPFLQEQSKIIIIGSWYNILGLMLMIRNPHKQFTIKGIDVDIEAIKIADKLTEAWRFEAMIPFKNEVADASEYDYSNYDVIINTSIEHMSDEWFYNVPNGKIVCLQSMSINVLNDPIFKITNPNPTFEIFMKKYNMTKTLFKGEKKFDYATNPYTRFCHIGIK